MTKLCLLLCLYACVFVGYSQVNISFDFEDGDSTLCQCPPSFTCYNDAGRVIDGVHPVYVTGDLGCVGVGPMAVNHTNSLGAHSGSGYLYFYAGGDFVRTYDINFPTSTQVELGIWYCGPEGPGDVHQNTSTAHFSLAVDGAEVSPSIEVPSNTPWTFYSVTVSISAGNHNFTILTGGIGQYALWFDDLSIQDPCASYNFEVGDEFGICDGESIQVSVSDNYTTMQWADGSSDNPYEISQPGIYSVDVTLDGCEYSDTIEVVQDFCPCEIDMPNVFTPNEDNLNDRFIPRWYGGECQPTLKIFNRWGNLITETTDMINGWDGTLNEKSCVEGVYFWTLEYTDSSETMHTRHGHVTLIRN
ncbi:MAG: gliding motility-associated C-terminal domain-containing protein [bacterium]|nr:gliding motility-associated C-terminal domain-containing protein [bacterium]